MFGNKALATAVSAIGTISAQLLHPEEP